MSPISSRLTVGARYTSFSAMWARNGGRLSSWESERRYAPAPLLLLVQPSFQRSAQDTPRTISRKPAPRATFRETGGSAGRCGFGVVNVDVGIPVRDFGFNVGATSRTESTQMAPGDGRCARGVAPATSPSSLRSGDLHQLHTADIVKTFTAPTATWVTPGVEVRLEDASQHPSVGRAWCSAW